MVKKRKVKLNAVVKNDTKQFEASIQCLLPNAGPPRPPLGPPPPLPRPRAAVMNKENHFITSSCVVHHVCRVMKFVPCRDNIADFPLPAPAPLP